MSLIYYLISIYIDSRYSMDIRTLCLGLLSLSEASGYDLKKRIQSSFRFFYSASYGSIYPALASLAREDLVTWREVTQQGRPNRKVYRITDQGRRHLARTLQSVEPARTVRFDWLLLVYFSQLIDSARLQEFLDAQLDASGHLVEELQALQASDDTDSDESERQFVYGYAEVIARAGLDYITQNRHKLTRPQTELAS